MKALHWLLGSSAVAAMAWGIYACAPSGFASESTIASVRILASSASEPYAKPGDTVTVQVLAYDGRPSKPAPMAISWLPLRCDNPLDDAYYACFEQFAGGDAGAGVGSSADAGSSGDAGAGSGSNGGAGGLFVAGQDLTPFLIAGPSMTVSIPDDIITSHPAVTGTAPYGLVILFNFACAGHLQYVPPDPTNANPQQIPIGCFDGQGHALGPDDFVFGFTRIYASDTITDVNPVITHVDVPGGPIADTQGTTSAVSIASCSGSAKCQQVNVGPVIDPPVSGREVWADFYSTAGSFNSDARLLYGVSTGSMGPPSATDTQFNPPDDAGAQLMWIVVHDDHNGASWVTVPLAVH